MAHQDWCPAALWDVGSVLHRPDVPEVDVPQTGKRGHSDHWVTVHLTSSARVSRNSGIEHFPKAEGVFGGMTRRGVVEVDVDIAFLALRRP
jgi:hypothetical protein